MLLYIKLRRNFGIDFVMRACMIVPIVELSINAIDKCISVLIGFKGKGLSTESVERHLVGIKVLHVSYEGIQFIPSIGLHATIAREEINNSHQTFLRCGTIRRDIPDSERCIIATANEGTPVWRKGDSVHPSCVFCECGYFFATANLPEVYKRIPSAGKDFAIG